MQVLHPRTASQQRTRLSALLASQPASAQTLLKWLTSLNSLSHMGSYDDPVGTCGSDARSYFGSTSSVHAQARRRFQARQCCAPTRREALTSRHGALFVKPQQFGSSSFASGARDVPAPHRGVATESTMDIFDRSAAVYSTFPTFQDDAIGLVSVAIFVKLVFEVFRQSQRL